jgi:hypothetical protein
MDKAKNTSIVDMGGYQTELIGKVMTPDEMPPSQISQELKSPVMEFARNEVNRPDLAQLAYSYKDPDNIFIADQAAPFYPVSDVNGKYRKFNEDTFYNEPMVAIGKEDHPNKVKWGSAYVNYDLSGRALSIFLSKLDEDQAITQYGSIAKWRAVSTLVLTRMLLLQREREVATLYQTTANFASGYYSTPTAWTTVTTLPKSDVITAVDTPLLAPPNTIICAHDVYRCLQKHADVRSDVTISVPKRAQGNAIVDIPSLAAYFDINNFVVGSALYNSTPASSSPTFTRIWLNYFTVCRLDTMGGTDLSPSFAVTFKLQTQSFPNVSGWSVKSVMDNVAGFAGGELLMVGYWAQPVVFSDKTGYSLKAI